MSLRPRTILIICLLLMPSSSGCRQLIKPEPPDPLPFPPTEFAELEITHSGLVVEATGVLVATNPTALRFTTTVRNPTAAPIVAEILRGDCEFIVAGFWQQNTFGKLLQPLDGLVTADNDPTELDCELIRGLRPIGAGETVELTKSEDLVVSEVLGDDFVPGRYYFTVVYVDTFVYQVEAANLVIEN